MIKVEVNAINIPANTCLQNCLEIKHHLRLLCVNGVKKRKVSLIKRYFTSLSDWTSSSPINWYMEPMRMQSSLRGCVSIFKLTFPSTIMAMVISTEYSTNLSWITDVNYFHSHKKIIKETVHNNNLVTITEIQPFRRCSVISICNFKPLFWETIYSTG